MIVYVTPYLGDTVTMLPLVDRLHEIYAAAEIDIVTSAAMTPLLNKLPYIHRVFGVRMTRGSVPVIRVYIKLFFLAQFVRSNLAGISYDLCLVARWGSDPELSPYLGSMIGAATLLGHDPSEDMSLGDLYPGSAEIFDCASSGGQGLPEAVRQLRLLQTCGMVGPLDLVEEEKKSIAALIQIASATPFGDLKAKLDIRDRQYIVLAPGASLPSKRWPASRFREVAEHISNLFVLDVVILGGSSEANIGNEIAASRSNFLNLAGQTSLLEMATLMLHATLIVANDSGPAHMGAGLGTPTIVISPTSGLIEREVLSSPLRFRPIGPAVTIIQPSEPASGCTDYCTQLEAHCIKEVRVETVVGLAETLLTGEGRPHHSLQKDC